MDILTSQSAPAARPLGFRALLERAGSVLACRFVVSAVVLGQDEFSGMVLGYLGNGATQIEPFHVRFDKERATHLLIGDLDAVHKCTRYFETSPVEIRRCVARARECLVSQCEDTGEGAWCLRQPRASPPLRWLRGDTDCAIFETHPLDERLWVHISAHLGVPVGLET